MNLDKNWVHYLTRPYTLFGASLWRVWYSSERTKEVFGITMPDTLCIEEHKNVVRRYAVKEQLDHFKRAVENKCLNEPQKCISIFQRGIELNKEALSLLTNKNLKDFKKAVDFLIELTLHATIFPFLAYETLHKNQHVSNTHAEALALAERLREHAHWTQIVDEIVIPLAQKKVGDDAQFMTFQEVLDNQSDVILERKQNAHKRFIYQYIDGKESVEWVPNALDIMKQLEPIELGSKIKGRSACPGKVKGTARLVLTNDISVPFNNGDILVAANTNPLLMPLIAKCSAIVTDEGGITSHAAIISRELNKPCVIGTKVATHAIKDGDLIEVDAEKGIIKIVK